MLLGGVEHGFWLAGAQLTRDPAPLRPQSDRRDGLLVAGAGSQGMRQGY